MRTLVLASWAAWAALGAASSAFAQGLEAGVLPARPTRTLGRSAASAASAGAAGAFAQATSVIVNDVDEPLLALPDGKAARRGSAGLGSALPLFGTRVAPGCALPWLLVGPHAWLCGSAALPSKGPGLPARPRDVEPSASGLPHAYYFVGSNGSSGYPRLETAEIDVPIAVLEPGFAVAIVARGRAGGEAYGRTGAGVWVPMRDLGAASPSAFQGVVLGEGELPESFAWALESRVRVMAEAPTNLRDPASAPRPSAAPAKGGLAGGLVKFERVRAIGEAALGGEKMLHVEVLGASGERGFVRAKDMRRPTRAALPPEIDEATGERWVDVDLATQTLVAYEGARPVFATLVSTGRGRQGSANATPLGTHRVWVKLASAHMDNLEDDQASRFWRMENVPWVQYFSKGVGLHGAFWHKGFGRVRSHGCVNLAPRDAERLFSFTGPRLPAGWTAVLPSRHDRASLVRVR